MVRVGGQGCVTDGRVGYLRAGQAVAPFLVQAGAQGGEVERAQRVDLAVPLGVERVVLAAVEQAVEAGLADPTGMSLATVDAEGRPLAGSLRRWPLVAAGDVPPISVTFLPTDDPSTRFGAMAVGETAGRAAVAAIAAAVAHASGGTVRSLPLDPGTVLDLQAGR